MAPDNSTFNEAVQSSCKRNDCTLADISYPVMDCCVEGHYRTDPNQAVKLYMQLNQLLPKYPLKLTELAAAEVATYCSLL